MPFFRGMQFNFGGHQKKHLLAQISIVFDEISLFLTSATYGSDDDERKAFAYAIEACVMKAARDGKMKNITEIMTKCIADVSDPEPLVVVNDHSGVTKAGDPL